MPCTVTLKFPVGALTAAPKTTGALVFAGTVKGLAGFDSTPAGKPPSVICTTPLKPFCPFTEILSAEVVAPCMTVIELDERTMEKSWAEAGGGVSGRDEVSEDAPCPHPAHAANIMTSTEFGTPSRNR